MRLTRFASKRILDNALRIQKEADAWCGIARHLCLAVLSFVQEEAHRDRLHKLFDLMEDKNVRELETMLGINDLD